MDDVLQIDIPPTYLAIMLVVQLKRSLLVAIPGTGCY